MADQDELQNKLKQAYFEHLNTCKDSLKKKKFEVELWKMKIEMILNMKKKEMQTLNDQITEMRYHQNKFYNKKMQNCNFVHNLVKNSWLSNVDQNLQSLIQNEETKEKISNTSTICNKLQGELYNLNALLDGIQFKQLQEKKIIECSNKINNVQHSTTIWNDSILKIEKEMLHTHEYYK